MSNVIDLASRRQTPTFLKRFSHPAGVNLPLDEPLDAELVIPEVRSEICAGTYSADIIRSLPKMVQAGDRVLVIGAGLGVVSTLVAREGASRVIAVEANIALIPYLKRVHALNGAPWIETINAVLGDGTKGRIPFFAQRDPRMSSLLPDDFSWQQVSIVPLMDLNLILVEEQINLIICDIPTVSAKLFTRAELRWVERILVNRAQGPAQGEEESDDWSQLATQGFVAEPCRTSVLFGRTNAARKNHRRSAASNFLTGKLA